MRNALIFATCMVPMLAQASAPPVLSHAGRLLGAAGEPINGPTNIRVTLFDTETSTPGFWTREYTGINVEDGYYAVSLVTADNGAAINPTAFEDGEVWLQVAVGGIAIGPRTRLGSVPYALVAGDSGPRNLVWSTGTTQTDYLTVSTAWQMMPDLTTNPLSITTGAGTLRFGWRGNFDCDGSRCDFYLRTLVDGAVCGNVTDGQGFGRDHDNTNSDIYSGYHVEGICNVGAGTHTVTMQYRMAGNDAGGSQLRHHADLGRFLFWAEEI